MSDRPTCAEEDHSWRVRPGDFSFAGHRDGGGIANRVRRVCELCAVFQEQIEVSFPAPFLHGNEDDRRYEVEDPVVHPGPAPRAGSFQ